MWRARRFVRALANGGRTSGRPRNAVPWCVGAQTGRAHSGTLPSCCRPVPLLLKRSAPAPWRIAELEELVHTQENQLREKALRDGVPPALPVDSTTGRLNAGPA